MSVGSLTVNRFTLPNGLRVVHSQDSTTAMVAVNVLYNVGSRDESPSLTGMAHLFEHLMFGGSAHAESFDGILEDAGGTSNAWTSNDFTNFYDILPAQNIETALFLESDRMLSPNLKPKGLEVQKGVVIEEFKQTHLDRPYGDVGHIIRRLVYKEGHPYSWPTIGKEPDDIARVTVEDARKWFYSHYAPNNAILAITGNVDPGTVRELVEKWFGDVPRRELAPRTVDNDCFRSEAVTHTAYGNVPVPVIVMAYPMDPYGTEDYFLADAVTDVLSLGKASRFSRELVYGKGQGLITSADASISGSEHPGMLLIQLMLADNRDTTIERAIALAKEQLHRLGEPGNLGEHEFRRVQNRFEANFRFNNVKYLNRAQDLAMAEYHGEDFNRVLEQRMKLTPEKVEALAAKIFRETEPITLIYRPKESINDSTLN